MGIESKGGFRSRPDESARNMHPEEIENAQVRVEAAVKEELGSEPDYSTLSPEELQTELMKNVSRRESLETELATARKQLVESFTPTIEAEFAQLKQSEEPSAKLLMQHVADNEESSRVHSSPTMSNTGILMDIANPNGIWASDRQTQSILNSFSPSIQEAITSYYEHARLNDEQSGILNNRIYQIEQLRRKVA